MGGSIGPEMEICETSGLPIPIVPRFHKRNVHMKRKLRAWRPQTCIALVRGKTPPTCACLQTTPFHGWQYRAENGNMNITSGLLIPMVPHFHRMNVYIKWKLRVWRSQKGIALVGAEAVLTSVGPQTTPFHEGQYKTAMEICETSGQPIPMVPCFDKRNVYI